MNQKQKTVTTTFLIAGALATLTSCSSVGQYSKTKEEFKEATGQTLTSWSERKNKFISKSENRINDIAVDLTSMKNNQFKLPKSEREKALSDIDKSSELVDEVRSSLNELKKATASEWQDEKREFLSKMDILDNSFENTRSYFN